MNPIHFSVLKPSQYLSRDIECLRVTTQSVGKEAEVKVCPSGFPGIVFQLAEDGTAAIERIETRKSRTSNIPLLFLHGQGSDPSVMHFKAIPHTTIQVVFKSHALYTLFGLDASSIYGGFLTAEEFGATELEMRLLSAETNTQRVALLEAFLANKLGQAQQRDEMIERMLEYMREHVAELSVNRVLSAYPISERQFQKRFARVVGMPPQLYIRLVRVNEAIRLMNSGLFDRLSDIAYQLNYYDQSHFIREIKTFSWVNPKKLTMKIELQVDVTGASYV
jgi:AraC-like DNA-binding protein